MTSGYAIYNKWLNAVLKTPKLLLGPLTPACPDLDMSQAHYHNLNVNEPDKEDNCFYIEFYFTRHQETDRPHQVKLVILTLFISWPNPLYQEEPERAACAPSWTSIALDNTFGSVEEPEGSTQPVPPGY